MDKTETFTNNTISLEGEDASAFSVNEKTGLISVKDETICHCTTKTEYEFTAVIADAGGNETLVAEVPVKVTVKTSIVKTEAKPATCCSSGNIACFTCSVCGRHFSDEKATTEIKEDVFVIKALGHDYGEPRYAWSDDGKSCVATVICKREGCNEKTEGHIVTENAVITSTVKEDSTIEKVGTTTYIATFKNKLFAGQSKDVADIPLKVSEPEDPAEPVKEETQKATEPAKGATIKDSKNGTYTVTSDKKAKIKTVAFDKVAAKSTKDVTIPATIKSGKKTYKVTTVKANAFNGSKAKKVTLGKNVKKLSNGAFKKSKVQTLVIKTKKLTKSSVKGAFNGSGLKVIKVKVNIGTKEENIKYKNKIKKFFTKKNLGVKVVFI